MGPEACSKLEIRAKVSTKIKSYTLEIRAKVKTQHIEQHKELERKHTLTSILDIECVCDKFEGE